MTRPLTSVDFFALEAGDCLSRIEQLVTAFETPPADELLRAARALRGAAVLAQHDAVADAAAGYEAIARAVRDGLGWSGASRSRVQQTIEEFRRVILAAGMWTPTEERRARDIARTLTLLAGGSPIEGPVIAPAAPSPLAPGVRAFVAREGALVASALADAARRLHESPDDCTVLQPAARRLLALRGLGDITELSPLPEVLDVIELLADDLPRIGAAPPNLAGIADAAAAALARICREVAGDGLPSPDAPDSRHLLSLVTESLAIERDVVPIHTLQLDGEARTVRRDEDHGAPLSALALVSLGEHLAQAGEIIVRVPRGLTRDLRAYAAIVALRRAAAGGPPASALRQLLMAVREALGRGVLREAPELLGLALRDVGALLRDTTDTTDRALLAAALADLAARLAWPTAAHDRPTSVPASLAATTVASLDDAVPIATLLLDDAPAATPRSPSLLATTFDEYFQLRAETASLATVVAIHSLCYHGPAALTRALEVRGLLVEQLAAAAPLHQFRPLLDELLDLVPLAHGDD